MPAQERYQANLTNPRQPGTGCHGWILSTANLAVMAGLTGEKAFQDIQLAIPPGNRRISDREIQDAICKALSDHKGGTFTPGPRLKPVVQDGKKALKWIIDQGKISDAADLWEASPVRLWDEPKGDMVLLFETLYDPTELIWIGERFDDGILGKTIRTATNWITYFQNGGKTSPYIILNPLTGTATPTKSGDKTTLRGDGNVTAYRYCVCEFDTLSREDQILFWSAVKLPIVALIDSGGKSIHAWFDVQKLAKVETAEQWQAEIKLRLYDRILTPLGVDGACSNPARLSRLPGHYRSEKGAYQRLLWLSAGGWTICQ